VIKLTDLAEKTLTRVDVAGMPAVLWKEGPLLSALAATCSHLGGPLDEGTCQNGTVACPWHGSTFRWSDGSVVSGPAIYAQPTFAARIRAGNVELRRLEQA
jgi:nitrite reductase/ring-hydroxylating ferredoxin subunit